MNGDLVEMVETAFGSVWAVELLLVLCREPRGPWTAAALVQELRSSEVVVSGCVHRLVAAGLAVIDADNSVHFAAASPAQEDLVMQLQEEYRIRPAAIRRLILASPDKLKSFADAFRWKKD
jgi:hypothetical protein